MVKKTPVQRTPACGGRVAFQRIGPRYRVGVAEPKHWVSEKSYSVLRFTAGVPKSRSDLKRFDGCVASAPNGDAAPAVQLAAKRLKCPGKKEPNRRLTASDPLLPIGHAHFVDSFAV